MIRVPVLVYAMLFVALLLAIGQAQMQARRRRYRQLAADLSAAYRSEGPFRSGTVAGNSDRRSYTIRNEAGSRGSTVWTIVEMHCADKGIPLYLHGPFFKNFPDWRYALTRGDRSERLFFTQVQLQGVGIPLGERQRMEVQQLFQEFALAGNTCLMRGVLRIEQDTISFTVRGILTKLDPIRDIIGTLARIADRIEAAPIV